MTQVSLVDSTRLSILLRESLEWSKNVSSIMVSAQNGSILAYAFRHTTPSVKAMRTRSITVTTAYSVAAQEVLVFEAQRTGAMTVISSIADRIVLAVTGPEPEGVDPYEKTVHESDHLDSSDSNTTDRATNEEEAQLAQLRSELESVNDELAGMLREELAGIKWPEDI